MNPVALIARGVGHERAASHGCDIAVGINHAAAMFRLDWWVFLDMEVGRDIRPIGTPSVFTSVECVRRMRKRLIAFPDHDVHLAEHLAAPRIAWTVYSSCAALMFISLHLKASEVRCFGVYTANFPEPVPGEGGRWKIERDIWRQVIDATGIKVTAG